MKSDSELRSDRHLLKPQRVGTMLFSQNLKVEKREIGSKAIFQTLNRTDLRDTVEPICRIRQLTRRTVGSCCSRCIFIVTLSGVLIA